jgi:ergothioneine biosynthesis protein EgtB
MHDPSVPRAATLARQGGAADLAAALAASRADTLATFAAFAHALPGLEVPLRPDLNPPLWELGHAGWFQERWTARFPQRALGCAADPDAPLAPASRREADALYDSSQVAHDTRWQLALPAVDATRSDLAHQLAATLALLQAADCDDASLYFFRLVLLHEDMHHEAALYVAQSLGIAIDDARWQAAPLPPPRAPLTLPAGEWQLGSEDKGFVFDNEWGRHAVALGDTTIDAQVVRWAEFLPFVEQGAYAQDRWWTDDGLRWRMDVGATAPRYLKREGATWSQWRHGLWRPLDLTEAACHLTLHEARAWCRWAGRRLPDEAEWERAAVTSPGGFRWGDVWEWTASRFTPYPGFRPHPYRDYSAPWFDGRPVLRGASFMTQPRMRHPRYRNFFPASRNDVPAGFRSCALP